MFMYVQLEQAHVVPLPPLTSEALEVPAAPVAFAPIEVEAGTSPLRSGG